jgi:ubiquinone biosynthesis accessory factor UbiK
MDNGFAACPEILPEWQRTKCMHKNSAAHTSGATLLFATLPVYPYIHLGTIAMLNTKFLEEMTSRLKEVVANSPARDFEKNARALLAQGFSKLDLVTREEYEVLAQRLDKLEARIATMEAQRKM